MGEASGSGTESVMWVWLIFVQSQGKPQGLVFGSIYQGAILVSMFLSHSHVLTLPFHVATAPAMFRFRGATLVGARLSLNLLGSQPHPDGPFRLQRSNQGRDQRVAITPSEPNCLRTFGETRYLLLGARFAAPMCVGSPLKDDKVSRSTPNKVPFKKRTGTPNEPNQVRRPAGGKLTRLSSRPYSRLGAGHIGGWAHWIKLAQLHPWAWLWVKNRVTPKWNAGKWAARTKSCGPDPGLTLTPTQNIIFCIQRAPRSRKKKATHRTCSGFWAYSQEVRIESVGARCVCVCVCDTTCPG